MIGRPDIVERVSEWQLTEEVVEKDYLLGWLLWGIFLMIPMMRHPKVAVVPELSRGRLALAIIGLVILMLTFTPTPFYDNSLMHFFHIDPFRSSP